MQRTRYLVASRLVPPKLHERTRTLHGRDAPKVECETASTNKTFGGPAQERRVERQRGLQAIIWPKLCERRNDGGWKLQTQTLPGATLLESLAV